VHLFHRGWRVWNKDTPSTPLAEPAVLVLDSETGRVLRDWGSNRFVVPHGLTIDSCDNVWLTDVKLHQVFKFSPSGQLLLTIGEAGVAGRDGEHFNGPTDVAVLPNGSFYVADGYGNARVAKFSADGRFEFEWGSRGISEGQFRLPHAIAIGAGDQVYVADRENSRVQVFSNSGEYLRQWSTWPLEKPFGLSINRGRVVVTGDAPQQPSVLSSIRIAQFTDDGTLLSTTTPLARTEPGGDDVGIANDGSIFVVGPWEHGVEKFVPFRARRRLRP
jgi:peptidylamidoglycolate lyase